MQVGITPRGLRMTLGNEQKKKSNCQERRSDRTEPHDDLLGRRCITFLCEEVDR